MQNKEKEKQNFNTRKKELNWYMGHFQSKLKFHTDLKMYVKNTLRSVEELIMLDDQMEL